MTTIMMIFKMYLMFGIVLPMIIITNGIVVLYLKDNWR
jgi:hypothetical protein